VDTFLFVDGTKSDAMFADLGWDVFDGMKGTAPGFLPPGVAALAFDAAFEAEYGETPPLPFLRETYDAVYLIALAAETAGSTDPTAIRDALRDVAGPPGEVVAGGPEGYAEGLALIAEGSDIDYAGAAGPVDFDDVGDVLLGAIETWHVDAANETFVTDDSFQVDLTTGVVTKIE